MKTIIFILILSILSPVYLLSSGADPKSVFNDAVKYFTEGNLSLAEDRFTDLSSGNYKRDDVNFYLGKIEFIRGRYKNAANYLDNALSYTTSKKKIYQIQKSIGRLCLATGEYGRALSVFEDLNNTNSKDADVQYLLAKVYFDIGLVNDSLGQLNRILKKDKNNVEALVLKGRILENQGKLSQARQIYEKIINELNLPYAEVTIRLFKIRLIGTKTEDDFTALKTEIIDYLKDRSISEIIGIGELYFNLGRYKDSQEIFMLGEKYGISRINIYLGMINLIEKDYARAKSFLGRVSSPEYAEILTFFDMYIKYRTTGERLTGRELSRISDDGIKKYLTLLGNIVK